MEILVCVKQVPDDSVEILFDESKSEPKLDGITPIVNAFDGYALEMAARYKEAHGGSISVVSLGSEKAKDAVRNCLAVGADNGFVLTDSAFDHSDTLATSYILTKALSKIEEINGKKFDIIFCGQEATDFTSGQVGAQMAELMGINQITNIVSIDVDCDGIICKQETEEGYNMISSSIPALVTVSKPDYDPRYPTMKNKMAARKMNIPVFTSSDLAIEEYKVGLNGSYVKVIKTFTPAKKSAGVKIQCETAADSAIKAVSIMSEAKIF